MKKLLVIGIDGLSPDLVRKWINELPNFKKIIDNGVFGRLESTIPPLTCPAWNSMITGKNPAKIGLFDWLVFPFDENKGLKIVNYTFQHSSAIWDYLGNFGKKIISVNVPITYPPRKVNGFLVCGLLTPPVADVNYTYPLNLKEELDKVVGKYEIIPFLPETAEENEDRFISECKKIVLKRTKASLYLMNNYEWDFFVTVYFITDTIQHNFWHYMDKNHPRYDPIKAKKYGNVIKEFYILIDEQIGKLLDAVPGDTNIIVVSDHGFGSFKGYFNVNVFLKQKGYLVIKDENILKINKKFIDTLLRIKNFILGNVNRAIADKIFCFIPINLIEYLFKKFSYTGKLRTEAIDTLKRIDWNKTQAFGIGTVGSIFINKKYKSNKKCEKIISNLVKDLSNLNLNRMNVKIYQKNKIYRGRYINSAPDILYIINNLEYIQKISLDSNKIWQESHDMTGWHRKHGVFIGYGPDIKKGICINNIKIYDITPTILYMFDLKIPDDIDGRVLTEIFEPSGKIANRNITFQKERIDKNKLKEKIKTLKKLRKI